MNVLYNKIRPIFLKDFKGQDDVIKYIKLDLKTYDVCKAYIFFGKFGTGKTSLARSFVQNINCLKWTIDFDHCNVCQWCIIVRTQRTNDFQEINAADIRGIDLIWSINHDVWYPPIKLKFKSYIIDEAHNLTYEAFNAMLKLLEEPNHFSNFILTTTDILKIPETIWSRCKKIFFNTIRLIDIWSYLQNINSTLKLNIKDDDILMCSINSKGSYWDAVSYLENIQHLNEESTYKVFNLIHTATVRWWFLSIINAKTFDVDDWYVYLSQRYIEWYNFWQVITYIIQDYITRSIDDTSIKLYGTLHSIKHHLLPIFYIIKQALIWYMNATFKYDISIEVLQKIKTYLKKYDQD